MSAFKKVPHDEGSSKDRIPLSTFTNAVSKGCLQLFIGFILSSIIGTLAYRRHSLSKSGIAGAIVTGTTSFGLGGLSWGLSLIFFFVSSSLLSHFKGREKSQTAADKFSKGTQRDVGQVLANGGVAAGMAVGYTLAKAPRWKEAFEAGYIGTLATANADTWATEIGVLSTQTPRMITTGQIASAGTSGGITILGTSAAASGALAQGLFFKLLRPHSSGTIPVIALVSGCVGCLLDSILGATVQAMYYCPHCKKETERQVHNCGTKTRPLRGIAWINNDVVNFLTTGCGGLIAFLMYPLVTRKHITK